MCVYSVSEEMYSIYLNHPAGRWTGIKITGDENSPAEKVKVSPGSVSQGKKNPLELFSVVFVYTSFLASKDSLHFVL